MTPEQRAFVVGEIEAMAEAYVFKDGCVDCASCAAMQAALFMLSEEAERDRRLGAAVRGADPDALAALVASCPTPMVAPFDRACDAIDGIIRALREGET